MRFEEVVATSAAVGRSSGRLEKIEHLARGLRRVMAEAPSEIDVAVALWSGAPRQGRIGLGYAAIAQTAGIPPAAESTLTLREVDQALAELSETAGTGSAAQRLDHWRRLLSRATADEQDFLRRLLSGELRQGALEGVVVEAVARAAGVEPARMRRGVMMAGDLATASRAALTGGEAALAAIALRVLQPVQPMLAQPADSVADALGRIGGDAALEYKLDGARIQVHKAGDEVRVFSRTLNDVTASVPEIVARARTLPARSIILDGEVLALTPEGRPHSFQTTMRRFGRTRGVDALQRELPLTPFFFDLLQVDDAVLIDEAYEGRVQALAELAPEGGVPRLVRPSADAAEAFAREAIARGFEGVMAKDLASRYAAGRRGAAWLKVKPVRTLDLVVLAAEWGSGRRKGWLSNLHLGARDPDTNDFVMLGKTFKGLTDAMLTWQTEHLRSLETHRERHIVYVRPSLVVEIAFNDLQISPIYPGGLALRFVRVKRYRLDKRAEEADTIGTVRAMAGV